MNISFLFVSVFITWLFIRDSYPPHMKSLKQELMKTSMDLFGTPLQSEFKFSAGAITVPLVDFYKGKTLKRAVSRVAKCSKCNGKGGKSVTATLFMICTVGAFFHRNYFVSYK